MIINPELPGRKLQWLSRRESGARSRAFGFGRRVLGGLPTRNRQKRRCGTEDASSSAVLTSKRKLEFGLKRAINVCPSDSGDHDSWRFGERWVQQVAECRRGVAAAGEGQQHMQRQHTHRRTRVRENATRQQGATQTTGVAAPISSYTILYYTIIQYVIL